MSSDVARVTLRLVACGGIDSSGGAGLDADREVAEAMGAVFLGVATCHTDQDAREVRTVTPVDPVEWVARVRDPDVLKFGLLPGVEHVRAAAALIRGVEVPVVVDPVIAATSGRVFLDAPALEVFRGELLPAGPVLTPNLAEAAALCGVEEPLDAAAREAAAARLIELGASAVIVTGGHGPEPVVRELVLAPPAPPLWLEHPRHPATLRGTGCRFASALAIGLARGDDPGLATRRASALVADRIAGS